MRFLRVLVTLPLWFLLVAAESPSPIASPAPPSPSPTPVPTPVPPTAFITLDSSSGPPNTAITVTGGQFLANQSMTLFWDQADHVAGSANSDANGSFTTRVKPFDGDAPGVHKLCVSVQPPRCANFNLEATATPSPTPSPSPSPSAQATPSASEVPTPSTTPVATTLNGLDVITRPPFVILPLIGILAIVVSIGYWILSIVRRPKTVVFPSAAVVHRATRPDYTAPFGTAPPTPAASPAASAWEHVVPKAPAPPQEPGPPPVLAAEPPAYDLPELPAPTAEEIREEMRQFLGAPDDPLDLPEPAK